MKYVALADVAHIQLGKMLSPKSKTGTESFPYLRNQNVQWQRFELANLATMDFSAREREKFRLLPGDLLVCEGGEPGRCAVWAGRIDNCFYQKALHRLRPKSGIADSQYLALWIQFQALRGAFNDQNAKTTIAHLPLVRLEQLTVPDVPFDKQIRIAKALNIHLAEVEKARQAMVWQLEDTGILRTRVLAQIFNRLDSVETKALGDYATTTSGSTPSRGIRQYWQPAEIPWVKTGEVCFSTIRSTEEAISKIALAECSLTLLPPQTVLIAMYGQGKTRGQSAILEIEATTNQACFAILPNDIWEPQFLYYWFMASYQDLRNLSENRGGNQANLNGALLNALEIPAADKTEQRLIVQQVKAALSEIETMEQTSKTMLVDIEQLPNRILAQAFES